MSSMSLEETTHLVNLLQSEAVPISQILEQFQKHFKPDVYSRMAISLRCMLEDNYHNRSEAGSNHSELLITHLLLWHLSKSSVSKSEDSKSILPNTRSVLYDQLQKVEANIRERRTRKEMNKDTKTTSDTDWEEDEAVRMNTILKFFLLQCVFGEIKDDWLCKTPNEVLCIDSQQLDGEFNKFSTENQEGLRERLREMQLAFEEERRNSIGGFLGKGISPIIAEQTEHDYSQRHSTTPEGSTPDGTSTTCGATINRSTPLRHEPIYERPRPPDLPVLPSELMFLSTEGYFSDLVMDCTCTSLDAFEVGELMQKAYQGRLNQDKIDAILNILQKQPSLLFKCGMSPERLQSLVENNHIIAEHFLSNLLNTKHSTQFLNAFVSGDESHVHHRSVDLVIRMASQGNLPKQFLLDYIFHCLNVTNTTQNQVLQQRHVKVVSLFAQNLIRNKVITDTDIFGESSLGSELHRFCVEFAKVKEVNKLYRLLKSLDPHNVDPNKPKDAE